MGGSAFDMGFVMDPVTAVDIEADTSFALMLEAQRRGHRLHYIDPLGLGVEDGRLTARVQAVELRRDPARPATLAEPHPVVVDDRLDVVFQRKDPPVDEAYVTATQLLSLCRRCQVLNRPSGILAANEKLYTLHFPELMPETSVTHRIPGLIDFMTRMGGEMIVKPLLGKGGEGIFHLRHDDRNLFSILEQATAFESQRVMAQRYLPEIRQGDKRILLLDGEALGAVLRVPSEREVRANLHVGGRAEKAALDADDRRIVDTLRPWLQRDGLFFVGIDVIGGRLTEVNVTSPTGIQEMSRLDGIDYPARVIDGVEARIASAARA